MVGVFFLFGWKSIENVVKERGGGMVVVNFLK